MRGPHALGLLLVMSMCVPLASAPPPKDWTILVYMDADNNLESVGIDDFLEMATVNLGADVNVVVQMDRALESDAVRGYSNLHGDWTTAKVFFITQGMTPDAANAIDDRGEVNMADPLELVRFVSWGIQNYPATYYFLVLWDHGLGWRGVVLDESAPGDRLTAFDLRSALGQIVATHGRRIDLLGNDACRMTLEIMYEVSEFVDYFVGSEKDEPLEGWPYNTFLGALAGDPSMTPSEVAGTLVDQYVESYEGESQYSVTLSAVNAMGLRAFLADFNAFLDELMAHEPLFANDIVDARTATERYEAFGEDYDLWHFVENVVAQIPSPRLAARALDLFASFAGAVERERHWDNPSPVNGVRATHAHGLALYFPAALGEPNYTQLALGVDSRWDEFLVSYGPAPAPQVALWANATSVDASGDGLRDTLVLDYNPGATGLASVEVLREGDPVVSRSYGATANRTDIVHIPLSAGGFHEVAFYLWIGGRIQNLTSVVDLIIEERIAFRGRVVGEGGAPLDGAVVTLTNLRTGTSLSDTAEGGSYVIASVFPTWFRVGDPLRLRVASAERETTLEFLAPPPQNGTISQDVRLATVGMGPWYAAFVGFVVVAAFGVAFGLHHRRKLRRFKQIP